MLHGGAGLARILGKLPLIAQRTLGGLIDYTQLGRIHDMAELKTRKRHEAELRRIIQRLTKMHARELAVYLATAKSLDDIPEEFWTRVQFDIADDEDDKAALLALIFQLSSEQHAESIVENYPLLAGVGGLAAVTIGAAATRFVRNRLRKISKPYVIWSKQLVRDAIEEIDNQGGPNPSRIDEAVKKVFGPYRANRMADTEANLVMIGGGEFAVNKSKIAVVRFWAHSKLRPPRHSNAEKKPCPICSPREGKAEADWGGMAPGHSHPGCDCMVSYVDEYGNIIGDDNDSDTFERFKDRLPAGFLKPREQMYRDHPEILESFDPAKHPRGQPGNPGQFASTPSAGGSESDAKKDSKAGGTQKDKMRNVFSDIIDKGVTVRSSKSADVDGIEFDSDEPTGVVPAIIKLSDGTDFRSNLFFKIKDGKPVLDSSDPDEMLIREKTLKQLDTIGFPEEAAYRYSGDTIRELLDQKIESLMDDKIRDAIRLGITREINRRKKDRELGKLSPSMKKYLNDVRVGSEKQTEA